VFATAISRAQRMARLWASRQLYALFEAENSADARAKRLLCEWLSPDQRVQFDTQGYFEVTGSHTGRRYRISHGSSANVRELDATGEPSLGLCFVPAGQLAPGDVMLAQKIALETSELEALAKANRFPPRLSPSAQPVRQRPF
jgi:hypothetical protein